MTPAYGRVFAGIRCLAVSLEQTSCLANLKIVWYRPTAETIFAEMEISLPASSSAQSLMIAGWMLMPRKAADDPAMDRL
jgi:hypothetical protein